MNKTEEKLNETKVLKGWRGIDVLPEVEENVDDIWMLIKYSDHGDEFLVVGTRDGKKYKYGCYANRRHSKYLNYKRSPIFYNIINDSSVSNDIYRHLKFWFEGHFCTYDKKYEDKHYAQRVFDNELLEYISHMRKNSDSLFDYTHEKWEFERWLDKNGIKTDENIEKLNNAVFHNRNGEYDSVGVAGKIDITDYTDIVVDDVAFIIINDKIVDQNKVMRLYDSDEWGVDLYSVSLKGFRQSKVRV